MKYAEARAQSQSCDMQEYAMARVGQPCSLTDVGGLTGRFVSNP